jgi:hypothetical protein
MQAGMEMALSGADKSVQMQAAELAEHEFDRSRKRHIKGRPSRRG